VGERQPEEVWQGEPVDVEGLLDLRDEGHGFLRARVTCQGRHVCLVKQVRQFGLRKGDHVKGASRLGRNEKNPALLRRPVNGVDPEQAPVGLCSRT
jgi:transcription termination factor Rho